MNARNVEGLKALLLSSTEVAGRALAVHEIEQLVQYYALVLKWNPRLHLTTDTEPEKFFHRHIFEAVFLARHFAPEITEIWDLGSGLGIPGLLLAVLRPELRVHLVEANHRKAVFLSEAAFVVRLQNLNVLNQRLESLSPLPPYAALTARAVEKMAAMLPLFLSLSINSRQMLLLGGTGLADEVAKLSKGFELKALLIPGSQARFLINLTRST